MKGLSIPAVKPTAAPSAIIAVPVTLSSPRNKASVIPIGTNIITSDDIPIVNPNIENKVKNTGITAYLCFENVFESFLHNAVKAPVDVITSKAPPIISINVIVDADFTIPVYIADGINKGLSGLDAIL